MKPSVFLLGAFGFAIIAAPRLASATSGYQVIVKDDWHTTNTPDCTICHQSNLGGEGTATKFFARSLQREGLVEKNVGSLHVALAALKAQNTDSDGDGISDIDELQTGSDPNDGPGPLEELPTPMTGCAVHAGSAHTRRNEHDSPTWWLALAAATLALRKRASTLGRSGRARACGFRAS